MKADYYYFHRYFLNEIYYQLPFYDILLYRLHSGIYIFATLQNVLMYI